MKRIALGIITVFAVLSLTACGSGVNRQTMDVEKVQPSMKEDNINTMMDI